MNTEKEQKKLLEALETANKLYYLTAKEHDLLAILLRKD